MKLVLPYPPSANHFHAVVRGRKITSREGRKYLGECASECFEQGVNTSIKGAIRVTIHAFRPRKSGDVDNIIKPVLDAMTIGGVYADDKQIVELHVYRGDDKARPRVEIEVDPVGCGHP